MRLFRIADIQGFSGKSHSERIEEAANLVCRGSSEDDSGTQRQARAQVIGPSGQSEGCRRVNVGGREGASALAYTSIHNSQYHRSASITRHTTRVDTGWGGPQVAHATGVGSLPSDRRAFADARRVESAILLIQSTCQNIGNIISPTHPAFHNANKGIAQPPPLHTSRESSIGFVKRDLSFSGSFHRTDNAIESDTSSFHLSNRVIAGDVADVTMAECSTDTVTGSTSSSSHMHLPQPYSTHRNSTLMHPGRVQSVRPDASAFSPNRSSVGDAADVTSGACSSDNVKSCSSSSHMHPPQPFPSA